LFARKVEAMAVWRATSFSVWLSTRWHIASVFGTVRECILDLACSKVHIGDVLFALLQSGMRVVHLHATP
jgi:hypothetical protein